MSSIDATLGGFPFDDDRDSRRGLRQFVPVGVALAVSASVAAWALHANRATAPHFVFARTAADAPRPASPSFTLNPYGEIVDPGVSGPRPTLLDQDFSIDAAAANLGFARTATDALKRAALGVVANPFGEIVNPGLLGRRPTLLDQEFSLRAAIETDSSTAIASIPQPDVVPAPPQREVARVAESAPLPPPRPAEFASPQTPVGPDRRLSPQNARNASPAAPADNRTFFERLFGQGQPSAPVAAKPAPVVAYAAPESRIASAAPSVAAAPTGRAYSGAPMAAAAPPPGFDRLTAVYDISARVVYLPDGTRLEAHSGYGDRLDDPGHVSERMRGATPPHVYELSPREELFHGVAALRMTPIGGGDIFGRAGLLAHSYMLGPNGDSNGCVSFKDYDAFLKAYQNGQIKRLAVVARLN